MTIETFSKTLTRSAMSTRLGVGLTAISNAISRGKFPPSWFSVLKQMAEEAGEECPLCLFAFIEPVSLNQNGDQNLGSLVPKTETLGAAPRNNPEDRPPNG